MLYTENGNTHLLGTVEGTKVGDWLFERVYVKTDPMKIPESVSPSFLKRAYPVGITTIMRGVLILKPFIQEPTDYLPVVTVTNRNKYMKYATFIVHANGISYTIAMYSAGTIEVYRYTQGRRERFDYIAENSREFINNVRAVKRVFKGKEELTGNVAKF